jgi:putative tryptophan/tyrosine transport system substrate-binding protein
MSASGPKRTFTGITPTFRDATLGRTASGTSMKRREFITFLGGAVAAGPLAAHAQKSLPRIGWLVYGGTTLGPIDQSLKDALAQVGLVDGRNIEIVFGYANGKTDQLLRLALELVAQKPDLLLAVGGDAIKPLFEASKGGIPIVGGVSDSPMRAGIAVSLARPSKNFTGITFLTDEMAAKRMEFLKEVAPNARRVAVIFNPQHFDDEVTFARRGAESLGLKLTTHPINSAADLDAALLAASAEGADSLFIISSRLTGILAAKIAQYGQERRLPVIASWREFAASGALLSYGPSRIFEAKRLAGYVQKVLNGAKPADLPIEQPVKFELVINLKTAKALGLNLPLPLLDRADELIE